MQTLSEDVVCGTFNTTKTNISFISVFRSNQKQLNLSISFIFTLFQFYYLIVLCMYLSKNLFKKHISLLIYWFEYFITLIISLIFTITYIIYLSFYVDDYWYIQSTDSPGKVCKRNVTKNPFGIVLYLSLVVLMIIVTTTILVDIIDGFYIVNIIKKILNINTRDFKVLSSKLNEVNIMSITNKKRNIIIKAIISFIYLLIAVVYLLAFFGKLKEYSISVTHVMDLFRVLSVLEFSLIYVNAVILHSYKKKLLENNYYSSNLMALKIYNLHTGRLLFFTDFLSYKSIVDLISNIPLVLFFLLQKLHTFPLIISYLSFLIYVISNGAIFIYVDKHIGRAKCSKWIKLSYLGKYFRFNFGEREKGKLYEEFEFELTNDEQKILNDLKILELVNNDIEDGEEKTS